MESNINNAIGEPGVSDGTSTCQQKSKTSVSPSRDSKEHWSTPRNVREFAVQANRLATMVLNAEVDFDVARTYATLARVVAQAASIEVTRSRFLKEAPDLSLEADDEPSE